MHKLIRYLLTPSVSDRPDIYQTSELAFSLRNKKSPIQNLHHLSVPAWAELGAGPVQPAPAPASSQGQRKNIKILKFLKAINLFIYARSKSGSGHSQQTSPGPCGDCHLSQPQIQA